MTSLTFRNQARLVSAVALISATVACSSPSSPTGTPSISAPVGLTPANNATIRSGDQPVTLVVQNAISTQAGATYTFEVASDAAFATKVQTKSGIAEGTNGQTSLKLDSLTPGHDYYWHARSGVGSTTGVFGSAYKFTISAPVSIDPPVPVSPQSGSTSSGWPTFTLQNSTRSGPAGSISYYFGVSTNSSFSPLAASGTVVEGTGRTSFTPNNQAPGSPTTMYWRATAKDQTNSVSSAVSSVVTFNYTPPTRQAQLAAEEGLTLWPGIQPPAGTTNGHSSLGNGWDVGQLVSFNGVPHTKPELDQLQIFDLIDRGMDPDAAIGWMNANGYPTVAVYYSSVQVIGFPFEYMALIQGQWSLVIRVGA